MKMLNIGSINLDKTYQVECFTEAGKTSRSLSYAETFGGKGLNQTVAMARAGGEVWHAGCVGHDGQAVVELMEREGVRVDHLQRIDAATGHAIIQVTPDGQNSILIHGGVNMMVSRELIREAIDSMDAGDVLVLQNEITNVDYAIEYAAEKGMIIVLNPSPIESDADIQNIGRVNYLVLNEIEGRILSGREGFEEILDALVEKYPNTAIVLTIGDRGVLYGKGDVRRAQSGYRVKVENTTAAGDTFTGFLISALSRGCSIEKALEAASLAGALCVSKQGAVDSIPTWAEVEAFRADAKLR